MLGLARFRTLPPETRRRKLHLWCAHLLHPEAHQDHPSPGPEMLAAFLRSSLETGDWEDFSGVDNLPARIDQAANQLAIGISPEPHSLHELCLLLERALGIEAAEWDLHPPRRPLLGEAPGLMAYCENLRSPFNVGSIIRSAEAFGFSRIILSPACPCPGDSPRLQRSAMGACEHLPWEQCSLESLLARPEMAELPVFALELGGLPIGEFPFPKRGIVVLGSEELGVHPATLECCRHSGGIVTIPLYGAKASLNVAVSFGIVAEAWTRSL